jgi:hypothetical protein
MTEILLAALSGTLPGGTFKQLILCIMQTEGEAILMLSIQLVLPPIHETPANVHHAHYMGCSNPTFILKGKCLVTDKAPNFGYDTMLLGQGYCTARGVVTEEYIATMEQ